MAEIDPLAKKDFFISYNKADRSWAEWIAWHLEATGGNTASQFRRGISEPAATLSSRWIARSKTCERIVAVLSPDYLTLAFHEPEWAAYFARGPQRANKRRIVPVRVRECELTGLLAPIVYIGSARLNDRRKRRESRAARRR